MKDSYLFYSSFDEALRELPDKSRLKVYDAVSDYALRGIEPDFNGMEKAIFTLIKAQIDRRNQRVENGKKGGRKKQVIPNDTQSEVKPYFNHTSSILEPHLNQSSGEVEPYFEQKEKVSPMEKESTKEKDITPERDKNIQESKKERYINKTNNLCACTSDSEKSFDFSSMTDEELIAWGNNGKPLDFDDMNQMAAVHAWNEELEKRAQRMGNWVGKMVDTGGRLNRLKSHIEVMEECGVPSSLRESLKEFLRHCFLNRHIVTNTKLEDIIFRLSEKYGNDYAGMNECVSMAIRGGYFDVKA